MSKPSLVSVDLDLTKPVTTLIKKVAGAVGMIYEPTHVRRMATAEAEASTTRLHNEIDLSRLENRAKLRLERENLIYQQNMEQIMVKTIDQLSESSDANKLNNDWLINFFDKARLITDEEMQQIWANILTEQINTPEKFSKRTVNTVSGFDKYDAETFENLCRFNWIVDDETIPLIFQFYWVEDIYKNNGINLDTINHLESIGLINNSIQTGYSKDFDTNNMTAVYEKRHLQLFSNKSREQVDIGCITLTKTGKELATICKPETVDDFFDYVKERWEEHLTQSTIPSD